MTADPAPPRLRLMMVAFSARFALEQLLDATAASLGDELDRVMVPKNYTGALPKHRLVRIDCGTSKLGGLLASINPWSHAQVVLAVLRHRPDVVHLLTGEGFPWAVTLAWTLKLAGIPLVITLHDPDPHPGNWLEHMNARIRGTVLRTARLLHIYSGQHRQRAQDLAPGAGLVVIPHGSFGARFLAYRQPDVARERLVLFFGRLEYYKGIDVLCRAMLALPPDIRLAIAGAGRLGAAEQALVAQLGGRAELHDGFVADGEVARLMQRAAVVALPYRHVTQSSVPAIAAAFGVPVVASGLGHFNEEIPALGGLLVPPDDPAALAQALLRVLAGPWPAPPAPMTFEALAPQFLALYRALQAGRPGDSGAAADQSQQVVQASSLAASVRRPSSP